MAVTVGSWVERATGGTSSGVAGSSGAQAGGDTSRGTGISSASATASGGGTGVNTNNDGHSSLSLPTTATAGGASAASILAALHVSMAALPSPEGFTNDPWGEAAHNLARNDGPNSALTFQRATLWTAEIAKTDPERARSYTTKLPRDVGDAINRFVQSHPNVDTQSSSVKADAFAARPGGPVYPSTPEGNAARNVAMTAQQVEGAPATVSKSDFIQGAGWALSEQNRDPANARAFINSLPAGPVRNNITKFLQTQAGQDSSSAAARHAAADAFSTNQITPQGTATDFVANPALIDGHYQSRAGTNAFGSNVTPEISSNDAAQRRLGDCGLVASLQAVAAADPNVISNNIQKIGTTPDGKNDVYDVKLYENGAWKNYRITSELPNDEGNDSGKRVSSKDDQHLWPSIYEKAFAVQQGGYQNLVGINADEVIHSVTGRPVESRDEVSAIQAFEHGRPVVVATATLSDTATINPQTGERSSDAGSVPIFGHHYYSIKSIQNDQVTVSNPWNRDGGGKRDVTMSLQAFQKWFSY